MELVISAAVTFVFISVLCPVLSLLFHVTPFLSFFLISFRGWVHFLIVVAAAWVSLWAIGYLDVKTPYGFAIGAFLASFVFMQIAHKGAVSGNNGVLQCYNAMAFSLHAACVFALLSTC